MLALPFDLSDAPPVRVLLTTVAEDDHYLAWSMHHIVADGWSAAGLLNSELSRAYGTSPDDQALPRLPIQPIDYEQWMVHWLTAQRRAALEGIGAISYVAPRLKSTSREISSAPPSGSSEAHAFRSRSAMVTGLRCGTWRAGTAPRHTGCWSRHSRLGLPAGASSATLSSAESPQAATTPASNT